MPLLWRGYDLVKEPAGCNSSEYRLFDDQYVYIYSEYMFTIHTTTTAANNFRANVVSRRQFIFFFFFATPRQQTQRNILETSLWFLTTPAAALGRAHASDFWYNSRCCTRARALLLHLFWCVVPSLSGDGGLRNAAAVLRVPDPAASLHGHPRRLQGGDDGHRYRHGRGALVPGEGLVRSG